jgi:SET domain-containing protein
LSIEESIIEGAGFGVMATKKIKKGELIMTYTGVIKPHYEVSAKNDSIFDIGVLDTPEQMMLMIDPLDQGNAGRFINTAEPECLNCIA